MATGVLFHTASQTTFDTFQEDEMQDIEQHFFNLNNRKQLIMNKVSILALGLMFLAISFWAFLPNPTNELPVENKFETTAVLEVKADPPSRSPLAEGFEMGSGFGKRLHPIQMTKKMHKGLDFVAQIGTPIYATSDGKVIKSEKSSKGYGNYVLLQHDTKFSTMYAHMSEITVGVGQMVRKGDIIGLVGSTGASTLPHLHYEVQKNGEAIDPSPFLKP
jgi:murein DD-endopeptidase MepM/ murein hydrolase activator NlpD